MSNLELLTSFIIGTFIGSFLNVLIWRLPRGGKITGRSHCPRCGHKLSAWELIPIFSFLALRGRCKACGGKISFRYPAVELLAGFLTMYAFWYQQPQTLAAYAILIRRLIILYTLLTVLIIDWQHYLIPDRVIFPSMLLLLAVNLYLDVQNTRNFLNIYNRFVPGIWSAGLAAAPFFLLWHFSKGRWMGFGDVKLALFLGVAFGWPLFVVSVLLGILFGGAMAAVLLIFGRKALGDKIALGTFLSLSGIITVFFGAPLWMWYMSFLRF